MARSDAQRWRDWRSNGGELLRKPSRCRACGNGFAPLIARQRLCERCAYAAEVAERADVTAALEERRLADETLLDLYEAVKPPLAAPDSYSVPPTDRRPRPKATQVNRRMTGSRGGSGHRSRSEDWAHVARRKARENWPIRKIAKFLDRPVGEVRAVLEGRQR